MIISCFLPKKLYIALALAFGFLFLTTRASAASGRDLPPLPASTITDTLSSAKEIRQKVQESRLLRARRELASPLKSPQEALKLYKRAVEHSSSDSLSSWKRNNAQLHRSKIFQEALRMRIRYTWLSLSTDQSEIARKTLDYSRALAHLMLDEEYLNSPDEVRSLLETQIGNGAIFQYLGMDGLLPMKESWEQIPGNLSNILEKAVRSPSRQADPSLLEESWQVELDFKDKLVQKVTPEEEQRYIKTERPSLMFRRAEDIGRSGFPNRATREILSLIKNHSEHKDFEKWEAYLIKHVSSPEKNVGGSQ